MCRSPYKTSIILHAMRTGRDGRLCRPSGSNPLHLSRGTASKPESGLFQAARLATNLPLFPRHLQLPVLVTVRSVRLRIFSSPARLAYVSSLLTPIVAAPPSYLYNRELAPACDRIGQPRVSWHSFRHTHQTLLHDSGASLKTSQELLGHSDLETTLNVYTYTVSDSQRNAVERVAGVLFGVLDSVGFNSAPAATPGGRPN